MNVKQWVAAVLFFIVGIILLGFILFVISNFMMSNSMMFLPDSCMTSAGFSCKEYNINESLIYMKLVSNMDVGMKIDSFVVYRTVSEPKCVSKESFVIGANQEFPLICGPLPEEWGLSNGVMTRLVFTFNATYADRVLPSVVEGRVYSRVGVNDANYRARIATENTLKTIGIIVVILVVMVLYVIGVVRIIKKIK